ncbi:MAG TPA: tetratricopeptide repeat protein, partial [Euzebya sp.]|nr:tetratricopeptide repeat protein [Euzebya sp.]
LQGLPAAVAAVSPLIGVRTASLSPERRRLINGGMLGVIGLGGATIVAGVLGRGPGAFLAQQTGVRLRRHYWDAAVQMAADAPLTGVGLDGYAGAYRLARRAEAATATDLLTSSDAAHSVPLHFLAGGGVLLLIGYLCLVVVTGFLLLRGLKRVEGDARLVLAAVSGLWLAYHVQSLVSIDVPALMTLHAVSAGLGIGLAVPATAGIRLPWAPPEQKGKPDKRASKGSRRRPATRVPTGRRRLGAGVAAAVVGVIGLLVAIQPVRADMALYRSLQAEAINQPQEAIAAAEDAATIGFWDPPYTHRAGVVHQQVGAIEDALVFFRRADARGLGQFDSALSAARGLDDDDPEQAMEWVERAVELEPLHPELLLEVATFYAANGRDDQARSLVDQILADDPDNTDAADLRADLAGA